MNEPEKIEKEKGGRRLELAVTAEDGELALAAAVERRGDGSWMVVEAVIDQTTGGALTDLGRDAFRVLAMVEVIVAKAAGLKVIDPQDELAQLRKENHRLKQSLWLAETELAESKGAQTL